MEQITEITTKKGIICPYCGRKEKGTWSVDFKHLDVDVMCFECKRTFTVLAGSVK